MPKFTSKSTRGFYAAEIHGDNMPADVVEISDEYHAELIASQSVGKIIDWSGDIPMAVDPPPPTLEQEVEQFKAAIQSHMDSVAKDAGYDDIKAAVTYAEEPAVPKFQVEGLAFRAWRSLVWDYGYAQLAKVASGERAKPTITELLAELPLLSILP